MKPEDILKLVNAGFSKSEIMAICGQPIQEAAPAPEPEPAPAPDPVPDPEPQQAPAPDPASEAIEKLTQQVSNLTNLVQKSNLLRSEQPAIKEIKPEDIIASIIYPTFKQSE